MAKDFGAVKKDIKRRMDTAYDVLKQEFSSLRTGRASTTLLDNVMVDAYGAQMPVNQVGTVNAPDPRLLTVQVWDRSQIRAVERAIMDSDLGLNPQSDGTLIRIPIPPLSEERRKEMSKVASKYTEQARVAVRNVRRDGMETLKKMEKDGDISEDELHQYGEEIQKLTDDVIARMDEALEAKEQEIMTV